MRRQQQRWPAALSMGLGLAATLTLAGCGSGSTGSSTPATSKAPSVTPSAETSSAAAVPAGFPDYSSFAPSPLPTAPSKTLNVAFLAPDTSIPVQKSYVDGIQDAAAKYNIKITAYDAGGFQNVAKQVSQFETALSKSPDAIILIPASPVAFNAQIAQAKAKKIPVLTELIGANTPDVSYSLLDPLVDDGAAMVKATAAKINSTGDVMLINGGAGGAPDALVTQGVKAALKDYPNMHLVFEKHLPSFDPSAAQTAAQDALVAHPDVKAVLTNSTTSGSGAALAFAQANKQVIIAGIGPNTAAEVNQIRLGKIAIAVTPPFYRIGELTMQWTLAILAGAQPTTRVVSLPAVEMTSENIGQAIKSGVLFQVLSPKAIGCGPGQPKQC